MRLLEPTITDLQAQIDRLSLAVHQARESQGHLEPAAQRLAQLSERCAEILKGWVETDQRHSQAVHDVETRLSEWGAIENRLQRDGVQRLRELQAAIDHEWQAIRHIHEEPVKQLREQAAALGEVCVSAANAALHGFERAEARIAALETNLQEQIGRLSHDVQLALAEVRRDPNARAAIGAPVEPFPLEGVMRIHEELRDGPAAANPAALALPDRDLAAAAAPPRPEASLALTARMESLEREVSSERAQGRETATLTDRLRRNWRWAFGTGAGVLTVAAVLGILLLFYVNRRLDEAATRVETAQRQAEAAAEAAAQQVSSTRIDADRQIAEARQSALKAEIVGNVLAAPDLIRFSLVSGAQPDRAYAQVLWSRSRGLVLSASRLPPAPPRSTYQIWLLTSTSAVSGGTFQPDAGGRATIAVDSLPVMPRAVIGVSVTLEPEGGSVSPTGAIVMARAAQ